MLRIVPSVPSVSSCFAWKKPGWLGLIAPHASGTPACSHTSTMRSASANVSVIGFSVITAFAPHSTASAVASGRMAACAAMATRSSRSLVKKLPVVGIERADPVVLAKRRQPFLARIAAGH